jgi:hypothetical protein
VPKLEYKALMHPLPEQLPEMLHSPDLSFTFCPSHGISYFLVEGTRDMKGHYKLLCILNTVNCTRAISAEKTSTIYMKERERGG